MIKMALAGNPNSGKTTLFNSLTGSTAHVGNWPGVTVDKREGVYKKCAEPITIVDLPGIYSLSPYSPEEIISRNFILDEKPDCIINIVDATNLERNLYLTTQLLEIDVPLIIALNMMDEVEKRGETIDIVKLETELQIKVVPVSALREENLDRLLETAYAASKKIRPATTVLAGGKLPNLIANVQNALVSEETADALFHAVKIIENDEIEVKAHPHLRQLVGNLTSKMNDPVFDGDYEAIIADCRYRYISEHLSKALNRPSEKKGKLTRSDRIDRVLTNRWAGIPIFIFVLFMIFHLTFSEDLFFLNSIGVFGPSGLVSFAGSAFEGLLADGGLNSPGVIFQNLLGIGTDSLTALIGSWLSTAPAWVQGFICDGVLAGLFSVLSFLPQILLLFLFFSVLEDSGYMARVAFILDRLFRRFGLSGRAFMPMIMGFGCSVPAMINTRTLADEKERTATIRVIPFFSCGAKLPILTAIAGGMATSFGLAYADFITLGIYVLGMTVAIAAVLVMRQTTMRGEVSPFIMELPTYRLPQFKSLCLHLWDKMRHFIKKAFTIILAATILIWFLQHFAWNWSYLTDQEISKSILASLGMILQPLFTPLGFGSQLTAYGWVFIVAAITGLIAKESVISTFAILAVAIAGIVMPDGGELTEVESVVAMIDATGISAAGCLAFIAFNMLTVPCFAAVGTAKAELPKAKFKGTLAFWLIISYLISSAIYLIGTFWWTSFLFGIVLLSGIGGLWLYNNSKRRQHIKENN